MCIFEEVKCYLNPKRNINNDSDNLWMINYLI